MGSIPGFTSFSDETLNRGFLTIFLGDKLLTRTYCDEAGDYVAPNVLSPRDLVFRPDIAGHKLYHHHSIPSSCSSCNNGSLLSRRKRQTYWPDSNWALIALKWNAESRMFRLSV